MAATAFYPTAWSLYFKKARVKIYQPIQ